MANRNDGEPKKDIGEIREPKGKRSGGTTEGGNGQAGNTSSTSTSGGTTDGGKAETIDAGKVVEIPVLNLPTPKTPAKKKDSKKETAVDKTLEMNVSMLLMTGFEFTATRLGEHWRVSTEEAKAISEPATRILQRLGINETANKYMDYFALLAGIGMVVVPRILITQSLPKQTEVKVNGLKTTTTNKKRTAKNVSEQPNPTNQITPDGNGIKANLIHLDY